MARLAFRKQRGFYNRAMVKKVAMECKEVSDEQRGWSGQQSVDGRFSLAIRHHGNRDSEIVPLRWIQSWSNLMK